MMPRSPGATVYSGARLFRSGGVVMHEVQCRGGFAAPLSGSSPRAIEHAAPTELGPACMWRIDQPGLLPLGVVDDAAITGSDSVLRREALPIWGSRYARGAMPRGFCCAPFRVFAPGYRTRRSYGARTGLHVAYRSTWSTPLRGC